jgi:hypothetical protein
LSLAPQLAIGFSKGDYMDRFEKQRRFKESLVKKTQKVETKKEVPKKSKLEK